MCKNILMNQHNNQSTIFLNPKIRYYIIIWLNISVFLFFPSSKNSNYTSKELPTNNNYWNTTFHIISYHIIQRNIYSSGLRKTTKTTIIYPKKKKHDSKFQHFRIWNSYYHKFVFNTHRSFLDQFIISILINEIKKKNASK